MKRAKNVIVTQVRYVRMSLTEAAKVASSMEDRPRLDAAHPLVESPGSQVEPPRRSVVGMNPAPPAAFPSVENDFDKCVEEVRTLNNRKRFLLTRRLKRGGLRGFK